MMPECLKTRVIITLRCDAARTFGRRYALAPMRASAAHLRVAVIRLTDAAAHIRFNAAADTLAAAP